LAAGWQAASSRLARTNRETTENVRFDIFLLQRNWAVQQVKAKGLSQWFCDIGSPFPENSVLEFG
jgi:hypothetical protein